MDSELNIVATLNYHLRPIGIQILLDPGYDQWIFNCLTCREHFHHLQGIMLQNNSPVGLTNTINDIIVKHNCYMNVLQNVSGTFGYMWLE